MKIYFYSKFIFNHQIYLNPSNLSICTYSLYIFSNESIYLVNYLSIQLSLSLSIYLSKYLSNYLSISRMENHSTCISPALAPIALAQDLRTTTTTTKVDNNQQPPTQSTGQRLLAATGQPPEPPACRIRVGPVAWMRWRKSVSVVLLTAMIIINLLKALRTIIADIRVQLVAMVAGGQNLAEAPQKGNL